ncbi:thrombospondin type 3 repeat-containing protein [Massilia yuzhufengensis]|uniref:FecR family protein n=1 Tax=Massilia yuzhufengensis TaxID=1164594 RepID=A0A1I1DDD4_9BURK|nr:thrombospondin type 3 repeat-containing protein [Massilia yuzhufengensis]SFB71068.1 hypothetical protein SAMN05216204_10171 [Massilia yuzhufengensis]
MNNRIAKTAVMLALAALSTAALAQDTLDTEPPGRVGRISLIQGKVSIGTDVGDTATEALVNWPVTTRNLITTEPRARTELRIGSTAIHVDGDSSLEVTELDDDSIRLRLHYGSASIRILSEEVLPEFELVTPQGRVRMLKPGRLRVDAERVRDTSVVSVFDGEAQVDGGGASLTIRAGRSAELRDDDVRTLQASRDGFDDWALGRDRDIDGSRSARYVTTEMTGYEELDRHGTWQDDLEYGPLWTPSVSAGWVPYRDGRWTWVAPWGWTWVDNASWGYAPFHYGRWVQVRNRWAWAPGQVGRRPVWAPALVGWVGGSGWNVNFNLHGSRPATGWYPLGPRDHFVPGYRLSDERLRRLNTWRDRRGDGRRDDNRDRDRDRDRDGRPDYRQRGLTVVPHANFGQRGPVVVSNVPRATSVPQAVPNANGAAPPPPQGWRERSVRRDSDRDGIPNRIDADRDGDGIPNRVDRDDRSRDGDRFGRTDRGQRPPVLATNPAPRAPAPAPVATPGQVQFQPGAVSTPPPAPVAQQPERPQRNWNPGGDDERRARGDRGERGERGERFDGRRERGQPMVAMPQQQQVQQQPQAAPVAQPPRESFTPPPRVMAAPPPQPAQAAPSPGRARAERRFENEDGGGRAQREK